MIKVKEVIVCEGRYDKDTLSQVFDAVIIETGGFGVFNDREKLALLRRLAEAAGWSSSPTATEPGSRYAAI